MPKHTGTPLIEDIPGARGPREAYQLDQPLEDGLTKPKPKAAVTVSPCYFFLSQGRGEMEPAAVRKTFGYVEQPKLSPSKQQEHQLKWLVSQIQKSNDGDWFRGMLTQEEDRVLNQFFTKFLSSATLPKCTEKQKECFLAAAEKAQLSLRFFWDATHRGFQKNSSSKWMRVFRSLTGFDWKKVKSDYNEDGSAICTP